MGKLDGSLRLREHGGVPHQAPQAASPRIACRAQFAERCLRCVIPQPKAVLQLFTHRLGEYRRVPVRVVMRGQLRDFGVRHGEGVAQFAQRRLLLVGEGVKCTQQDDAIAPAQQDCHENARQQQAGQSNDEHGLTDPGAEIGCKCGAASPTRKHVHAEVEQVKPLAG